MARLPWWRGGVLEQNIARTAASVGEALVAGAIFTLPAFLMVEMNGRRLWQDLRSHYWEGTVILLAGGLAGIFLIVLRRRASQAMKLCARGRNQETRRGSSSAAWASVR